MYMEPTSKEQRAWGPGGSDQGGKDGKSGYMDYEEDLTFERGNPMAGDGDDNEVNSKKSPEDQGQAEKDGSENRTPEQDRADEIANDQKRATGEFQTEALNEFKAESQRKTAENKKPDVPEAGQLDTMTGQIHGERADSINNPDKQNGNDSPNDPKAKNAKNDDSKELDSKEASSKEINSKEVDPNNNQAKTDDSEEQNSKNVDSKEKNAKEKADNSGELDGNEAAPKNEQQQQTGLGEQRSQTRGLNGSQLDLSTGQVLNHDSAPNAAVQADHSDRNAQNPRDNSINNQADSQIGKTINSAENTLPSPAEAQTQVNQSQDKPAISTGENTAAVTDRSTQGTQIQPAVESTANNNNVPATQQEIAKPLNPTDSSITPNQVQANPDTKSPNSLTPPNRPLDGAAALQTSSFSSFDTTSRLSANSFQPGAPLPEVKTVAVKTSTNNGADKPATTTGDQQTTAPQGDQTAPRAQQSTAQREQQSIPQSEQTAPQSERPPVPEGDQKPAQTTQALFSPDSIASKPVALETQPRPNDTSSNATQTQPEVKNDPLTPKVVKTERVTTQVQGDLPGSTPILQSSSFQPVPEAQRDVPITTVSTVNANDRLPQSTNTDSAQRDSADNNAQPRQQAAPSSDMMFNPTPIAEQRVELQSGSTQTGSAGDQSASKAPAGSSGVFFDSTPIASQRVEMSGGNTLNQAQEAHRQEPSSGFGSALNNTMFNPEPIANQNPSNYEQSSAGGTGNSFDAKPVQTQTVHEQVGGPSLGNDAPSSGGFTPHNEPLSQNVTMADVRPSSGGYGSSGSELGGGQSIGGKDPGGYDMLSPTPIAEQRGGLYGSGTGEQGAASASGGGLRENGSTASAGDGRSGLASSSDSHASPASSQQAGLDSGGRASTTSAGTNMDGSSQSLARQSSAEITSNHNVSSSQDALSTTANDKANQQLASTAADTTKNDSPKQDAASKPVDAPTDKPPSSMAALERNVAERTAQQNPDVNNRPDILASAGKDATDGSNTTQQERLQRIENLARMAQAFVSMDVPRLPGQVNVSDNQNGKSSFPQGSNIALARNSTGSVVGTPGELARSTVDGARSIVAGSDRFAGAISLNTLTGKGADGILGLNGHISRVGADGRLLGNPGQFNALTTGKGLFGDTRSGLPGENRTFRGLGTDGFNSTQQQGNRIRFDGRTGNPTGRSAGIDVKGIRGSAFDQQLVGPIGATGNKLNDRTITFKNGRLDVSSSGKRYLTGVEIALAAALAAAAIAKKRPEDDLTDDDLAKGQLNELLEGSGDEQKDIKSAKDSMYFRQSVAAANLFQRPTHLVQPNESLISIAEDYFNDSDVAWLIADINAANIIQHFEDGKRIVELKSRQEIQLPLPSEITDFFATKSKEHKGDLIVTIIVESQIDTELLNNFLGTVVGAAQTAQAPDPSNTLGAEVAALASVAEASFQDDTLTAIRNFGRNIMPTVHALLNSGKNLRTFISRVDEVPPTPTSPPSLKAVEKDKVTA